MKKITDNPLLLSILGVILLLIIIIWDISTPCSQKHTQYLKQTVLSFSIFVFSLAIKLKVSFKGKVIVAQGGAALLICLIWLQPSIVHLESVDCNNRFTVTIKLIDNKSKSLINEYSPLSLDIDQIIIPSEKKINDHHAFFDIREQFKGKNGKVTITSPNWELRSSKKDTTIELNPRLVSIILQRSDVYCCVSGYIKNENLDGIENVKIVINSHEFWTDKNGWFEINLPVEERDTIYKAHITHPRYKKIEQTLVVNSNPVELILRNDY